MQVNRFRNHHVFCSYRSCNKTVKGPSRSYPAGSRIRVGDATTQVNGEFVVSREDAVRLVEMDLGRLIAIGGGLTYGSSAVPVARGE